MPEQIEIDPEFLPSAQLLETVSWRVAAELIRRHPRRLRVVETHPGGGQYDCLTIIDRRGHDFGRIDLNRAGTAHVHRRFDRPDEDSYYRYHGFWGDYLRFDPLEVLRALERHAGLPNVVKLPASTAVALSTRLAAACVAPVALGVRRWEWRNGFLDTSGGMSEPREELFGAFPEAAKRRGIRVLSDPLVPEYRFWFLLRDDEPLLAIETVGLLWSRTGIHLELPRAYRDSGRRLFPIVNEAIGSELS